MTQEDKCREEAEAILGKHDVDLLLMLDKGIEMPGLVNRIIEGLKKKEREAWNRAVEECAKVAEETTFDRLCEAHEGECRTAFNGVIEIAMAIRNKLEKE